MPIDPESLYVQLGRIVEAMPELVSDDNGLDDSVLPANVLQWLARAHALVTEVGDKEDIKAFKAATHNLTDTYGKYAAAEAIRIIAYRALAAAELRAPAAAQGTFVPVGSAFDALTAIGKILASAKRDLLIIDPYMDEKVLSDFALLAHEDVSLRLLADEQGLKATLRPSANRWVEQYKQTRPLDVRFSPPRTLHDRLIIVDDDEVWVLTQSLNAFAARAPASIVRVDSETSGLKIAAYREIWSAAKKL